MKLHYFNQDQADDTDTQLQAMIYQGYVPKTCLLSGRVVFAEIMAGKNPCSDCNGPREKCKGRTKDADL